MSSLYDFEFYGFRTMEYSRRRDPDIHGFSLMCERAEDTSFDPSVRSVDVYRRIESKLLLWMSIPLSDIRSTRSRRKMVINAIRERYDVIDYIYIDFLCL